MSNSEEHSPLNHRDSAQEAAEWVLRHDRALTPEEQDAYLLWLAADPRNREAMAEARRSWEELDRLAGLQNSVHALPDPDLLRPHYPRSFFSRFRVHALALAAAALAVLVWWPQVKMTEDLPSHAPSYALAAPIQHQTLEDGTVVALNRGAVLEAKYTAEERRVRLVRGEANFTVAKNAERPFIVRAGGVDVRAVGTVFNVRLDSTAVEVVVTEGKVQVTPPVTIDEAPPVAPLVAAGERTVVPLVASASYEPEVVSLSASELENTIAWQPRSLDFTNQSLREIVMELNRRNQVQIVIADSSLVSLRLSATIRSDNVEGFVRIMESDFGMQAQWRGETVIVLKKK